MLNIGVVGFGYWGPNMVRNFSQLEDSVVTTVADSNEERLSIAESLYPTITTTTSFQKLVESANVDAVVVATPVHTHFAIAKTALESGKHVLLEKPMTSSSKEAEELIELANSNKCILMVDHTFLYTGAVQKIKELVSNGSLGNIQYFDSTRINLGLFQEDVNVIWDLAPHDISILLHIIDEKPVSVCATGISHTNNNLENIAYITVNFESKLIAHFNCSWTSPVKIRKILIGGDKQMVVFDDVEPTEKVKIYDTGFTVSTDEEKHRLLVDYRFGDIHIPKLETLEALRGIATDFVNAINKNSQPISDAQLGLAVVKILEATSLSIKSGGEEVYLNGNA